MMYDYIIIGAGISGLYSAYKLIKQDPNYKICILEKKSKLWIGGRANNRIFENISVVIGAGIVRKHKDHRLLHLLNELSIPKIEFKTSISYSTSLHYCNVKSIFLFLKNQYKEENEKFKKYGERKLGKEEYKRFIECVGLTDYEEEDVYETLYNYGFEDNYNEFIAYKISWKILIERLVKIIDIKNIHTCVDVKTIEKEKVIDTRNRIYYGKKIIIASTIDTVKTLLPSKSIYKNIYGQSFIRIYGKFSKKSISILKKSINNSIIVGYPLYKITSIDEDKGIYMIAYADNKAADVLYTYKNNKTGLCRIIENLLELPILSLHLLKIKLFYWKIGTHYYGPLLKKYESRKEFIKQCQNPFPNIYVVGEMISTNQGWTEGALESVDNII